MSYLSSLIAKKLDIEDEDLPYDSWVCSLQFLECDHKYVFLVLHLFRDISSFKSEKGDRCHVQTSFINKKDKYL